ncbi:MAG: TIGR03560 family F420-dependent LLM class oxidoreductase, partial [Candidatus Rokubacteria bacterium]|nr:TIGR03560 family F420-dependent LLM class oxidoreductase [Candidatus Rokubacteria bacterium]
HFMPNTPDRVGNMIESWTTLTALASLTKRMRVGTIVSGNTYRHPAVLAKMAANVDIISGGRLICGIGAGWQENEHTAYGMPFYTVGERLQRLDEACQVLNLLWTQERSTFKGTYYQLDDAPLMPKPVQKPRPELMIGGGGEKVTLKIVARWADHWNVWGGPEILAKKGKILDGYCAAIGRDPKTILRSAVMVPVLSEDRAQIDRIQQTFMQRMSRDEASAADTMLAGSVAQIQDKLGRLRAAGVGLLFIPTMFLGKDQLKPLDALIDKVAPALRKA